MMKIVLLITLLLSLGCADSFQTLGESVGSSDVIEGLTDRDLKASISSGPYEEFQVLNDIQASKLRVQIPVGFNSFVKPGSFSSADSQISGQILADANGYKYLSFTLPVLWISRGVNFPLATSLPNGDELDLFTDGNAPHVSVNLDVQGQSSLHLYFEPSRFGAFVQSPFDQGVSRQYPVSLDLGFTQIGWFSSHPHQSPLNGGLFLFISLPQ